MPTEVERKVEIAVIGAGMSGIAMGAELKRAGFEDFVILEKGPRAGGVWHWNHYPGLTCDVPSHLYQYSFSLNPGWKRIFATGPEIREYHESVADELGLRPHLRFNSELVEANYSDGRWHLRTSDDQTYEVDFVVMATGLLHHPNKPEVPGLDSFPGDVLHSAQWDDSVEIAGKRVAVVGTGSTGVQLVSAFQKKAGQVTLFARNPQWVVWAPTGLRLPPFVPALLRRFPKLNEIVHKTLVQASWVFTDATTRPSWRRKLIQNGARLHLRTIRDPKLRAALTPDYQPLCKRQVVSGSFYRAVQKPNVEVLREGVERVEGSSVIASDGAEREFDVIVFATGFKPHNYMRPMNLIGRDGVSIDEAWNDGPRAYNMTAVRGFPNLFMILGPNSPVGSIPLHYASMMNARYITGWLRRFARGEFDSIEVTEPAVEEFNAKVREGLGPTVWNTGCNSWYFNENGTIDLWPFDRATLTRMFESQEAAHFELARSEAGVQTA